MGALCLEIRYCPLLSEIQELHKSNFVRPGRLYHSSPDRWPIWSREEFRKCATWSLSTYIAHRIDLIFHQGNQWRDYNRRTTASIRGGLMAQRLSATCRHNDKCVAPVEQIKVLSAPGFPLRFIRNRNDVSAPPEEVCGFGIDAVSALHGKGRLVKGRVLIESLIGYMLTSRIFLFSYIL